MLLRVDGELVAVGADGAILVRVGGPRRRVAGELARLGDATGYHRLTDPAARPWP